MTSKKKTVNQPSTRKPETRRKQAILKIYQYLGFDIETKKNIRLPVFRARLINDAVSYEQLRTKTGLSDKAIKAVSEACDGTWDNHLILKVKEQLQKVFGFTDADFVTKAYTVDDANWLLVEAG